MVGQIHYDSISSVGFRSGVWFGGGVLWVHLSWLDEWVPLVGNGSFQTGIRSPYHFTICQWSVGKNADFGAKGCDWQACSYKTVAPGERFGPR